MAVDVLTQHSQLDATSLTLTNDFRYFYTYQKYPGTYSTVYGSTKLGLCFKLIYVPCGNSGHSVLCKHSL